MRYILFKKNVSINEIRSREEFLYNIFNIYTIPFIYDNYIEFRSIPEKYGNIIFINGHNNDVFNWLIKNFPKENIIVMISCYQGIIRILRFPYKEMYSTNYITYKLNGKDYGFDFDITDEELNLYNCPYYLIKEKLKYAFERIG